MENSINPVFGNYVVITKKNQKEMAERIVQQVLNGENNPVDVFVQIKGICDSLTAALKNKDLLMPSSTSLRSMISKCLYTMAPLLLCLK